MSFERLACAAVIALLATAGSASAFTITTNTTTAMFPALNLGTGSANLFIGNGTLNVNSGGITTISFAGGQASGNTADTSGVYTGNQDSIAKSPYIPPDDTTKYLVAQPGGSVTVNFASAQTTLDILWGTIDSASNYNLLTVAGQQIQGSQILNAISTPPPASGGTNAYVEITGGCPAPC